MANHFAETLTTRDFHQKADLWIDALTNVNAMLWAIVDTLTEQRGGEAFNTGCAALENESFQELLNENARDGYESEDKTVVDLGSMEEWIAKREQQRKEMEAKIAESISPSK